MSRPEEKGPHVVTGAVSGKHTAGPWVRGYIHGRCTKATHAPRSHPGPAGDDPCDYTYKAELEPDGDLIAPDAMSTILPRGTMKAFLTPEDGHLIAASPTMYAALQPAVLEEIADTLEGSGWARAPLLVVILRDQAKAQREALAKAEGRHDQR